MSMLQLAHNLQGLPKSRTKPPTFPKIINLMWNKSKRMQDLNSVNRFYFMGGKRKVPADVFITVGTMYVCMYVCMYLSVYM